MSFKITIINNETGETVLDREDAKAIVGAVTCEEETAVLGFTACNANDLMNTLVGVDKAKKAIIENSPYGMLLYKLAKAMTDED